VAVNGYIFPSGSQFLGVGAILPVQVGYRKSFWQDLRRVVIPPNYEGLLGPTSFQVDGSFGELKEQEWSKISFSDDLAINWGKC